MKHSQPELTMSQIMTLEPVENPKRKPIPQTDISVRLTHLVKEKRVENKISRSELALKSGVSRIMICKIEEGTRRASVEVFHKLFNAMGYPLSSIFLSIETPN